MIDKNHLRTLAELCDDNDWITAEEQLGIVSPEGVVARFYPNTRNLIAAMKPSVVLALLHEQSEPVGGSTDWRIYHSALSQCAALLDNMADGDQITDAPKFLAAKLAAAAPQQAVPEGRPLDVSKITSVVLQDRGNSNAVIVRFGAKEAAAKQFLEEFGAIVLADRAVAPVAAIEQPSGDALSAFDPPKAALKREDWDPMTRKPFPQTAPAEQPSTSVPRVGGVTKTAWEYSFIHSSAIGHGDSEIGPCLTYNRAQAYGVGCIKQREVSLAAPSSTEASAQMLELAAQACDRRAEGYDHGDAAAIHSRACAETIRALSTTSSAPAAPTAGRPRKLGDLTALLPGEFLWGDGLQASTLAEILDRYDSRQAAPDAVRDAARYRWFRDNYLKYGNSDPDIRRPIVLFEGRWYGGHFDNMDDLDVAIDEAMRTQPPADSQNGDAHE